MAVEWKRLAYVNELLGLNNLSDPGSDRILFWDDSDGALKWLAPGTNLGISGTDLNALGGGGTDHGALTGLGDDDHSQYVLANGTRAFESYLTVGVQDTQYGTIHLHGHSSGNAGGLARLYTNALYDDTIDYFNIQAVGADLLIGPNTDTDALKLASNKNLYLTDGSLYVQYGGTTRALLQASSAYGIFNLGTNDAQAGLISCYGAGTGFSTGGRIDLYLAADYDASIDYYTIMGSASNLLIGPNTDQDALKLDFNGDFNITAGSLVLPASEYVNFGGIQGSGGYGIRDNSGVIEHKHSGKSWNRTNSFVSRGNITTWDYNNSGLTADATWRSLDLSSIVPNGAVAICVSMATTAPGAHYFFQVKHYDYADNYNGAILCTQVATILNYGYFIIPCNSSRQLKYFISVGTTYYLSVLGWFI